MTHNFISMPVVTLIAVASHFQVVQSTQVGGINVGYHEELLAQHGVIKFKGAGPDSGACPADRRDGRVGPEAGRTGRAGHHRLGGLPEDSRV